MAGKRAASTERERRERSARTLVREHRGGWVGQSRDFSLAFSRRFVKAAKVVRPRVRGMKGEERVVDGRWWKGKARVLGTRRGMCRLTTPFESVDGCFDSSAAIPAGYETDLLRLREKEEKGTKR